MSWRCPSECPYKRYPKIPPSERFDADLAVVGEAPGITELARKTPFIGESGQVLEKSLAAVDLPTKQEAFLTNSMLCRPPKDKKIKFEAIKCCRARVIDELQEVQPDVVLILGASALKSITRNARASITRMHSKAFTIDTLSDTVMVPAFHPAALFRRPGDYKTYIHALLYASIILEQGSDAVRSPGTTTYDVLETVDDVRNVVNEISGIVGADIETGGLNALKDDVLCLGICAEAGHTYIIPDSLLEELPPDVFDTDNIKWCWHDGAFDTPFLLRDGFPVEVDHDTILQHYCMDEHAGGHDLETLSMRFLGASAYAAEVKKHAKGKDRGYRDVPRHILYPYLAKDCDYTKRLNDMFLPRVMNDDDLKKLYNNILMPATPFLRQLFFNGIYVDQEYTQQLDAELEEEENEIVDDIRSLLDDVWDPDKYLEETEHKTAGTDSNPDLINPNSTYQMGWVLFDELGLRRVKGTSTDKEVLAALEGQHPVIPLIAEYRSVRKKRSTYVRGILKRVQDDGRIHSRYSLYRTVTGRLSSRNPNMQNIQRDKQIKNVFAAPEGKKLLELDYKAAELRTLQYLSGDKELKRVFDAGGDLHDEVAESIFGPNFTSEQRVAAKTVNFGIAYGRTPYSIARDFEIPLEEAERRIQAWYRKFPEAAKYLFQCDEDAKKGKVFTTPFGRKRRFGLVSESTIEDLQKEARNFRIQSVASDLTLLSGMRVEPVLRARWDALVVNIVHDSLLIEVVDDAQVINEVAAYTASVMRQVPEDTIKPDIVFEVEAELGTGWGGLEEIEIAA